MTPDDEYIPELPPLDAYDELHDDPNAEPAGTNGHRPDPPRDTSRAPVGVRPTEGALADGHRPTDAGNADRLAARITREATGHQADGLARWIPKWGKWIVYDTGAWRLDDGDALITEQAKAVARNLFRHATALDGDPRKRLFAHAVKAERSASLASMVRLCRGTPGVRTPHTALDQQPWLLNVANGTIDLATGHLHPHDPEHLFITQTPVIYDPNATAPLWEECLQTWQPDPEIRRYLQLVAGAGATGHPTEAIVVNLGGGRNGKGKFWGAIQQVLGDYAIVADKSLIVVQRNEQHATVKARLFGARLAVGGETEAGDRLDEAKLKELTGGDLLEARRMREDPWKFAPTHTLVLHTNHRPRVRGEDEGIWGRIQLIPWDVYFAPDERDPALADKLAAEASGILNWVVAGAQAYIAAGLRITAPNSIQEATDRYRAEEDHVGRYLAEACIVDPTRSCTARDHRKAYETWCDEVGEKPWSAKMVGQHLTARGFDRTEIGHAKTITWIGFEPRDPDDHADAEVEEQQHFDPGEF